MAQKNTKSTKATEPVGSNDFFDKIDSFVNKRSTFLFILFLSLTTVFSILLFDIKLSTGGDDSAYIIRAFNFFHKGTFPSFQGPLYPMLISIPIGIWGINVPLLKMFSVLFMTGHVAFFYLTFRRRIPGFVLLFSTLFLSVNATLLYYSSQTYTEAFYFFIQSILIYFFFQLTDNLETDSSLKGNIRLWLLVGLFSFLTVITKNLGLGAVIAFIGYFIVRKEFKPAGLTLASFAIFYLPFELLKKSIWNFGEAQIQNQGAILLYKDPYDYSKGKEDFSGYISRFFDNAQIYLSKHLMHIWGFKPMDDINLSGGVTFVVFLLFVLAFIWSWKKSKHMLLLTIYTVTTLAVIFIVLQTRWDSDRLFLVVIPYITPVVLYGLYNTFKIGGVSMLQPLLLIVIAIISIVELNQTFKGVSKNSKALKKNIGGDKYYGYTEDWRNFLMMSEWCAKNLPPESYIMSRKAPMSMIYSNGKQFYEVYKVPSMDPDTLLNNLVKNKVTHVLHASLRRNPQVNNGEIITTTNNYLAIIAKKYPQKIKLIHQIGAAEPAYVYEIVK